MKVLIVEDDLSMLEIYELILKSEGHEGKFVSSKKQAEKYLNEKFDYAILDGLRGDCFDLYPKIKADTKIIITGNEEIFKECKSKNIKSLLKPVYLSEILK